MSQQEQLDQRSSFENALSQVRIVLVEPTHPGNIGSVARAMKTMGLSKLVLVNPKKFPHYEATKLAAGAESVLLSAQVVESAELAVDDCTMVIGTSVRDREVTWPTFDPRQTAELIDSHLVADNNAASATKIAGLKVAVLFGRESSGLTNSEMDLCQSQIRISANDEYSSLNLASAVQIIAYELRMRFLSSRNYAQESPAIVQSEGAIKERQMAATQKQKEGHIEHLQNTLQALSFMKAKSPTVLMRKLTRLYNKADLTVEDIQILRGILTAVQQQIDSTASEGNAADVE